MYDAAASALHAHEAGVSGYVVKDNSFEDLVMAVRSTVGGTFVTPAIRAKLGAFQRNGQPPAALSPCERELVRLIAGGKSSQEIRRVLAISPRIVDTCRNRLMDKLGLHSVADGAEDGGPGSVWMSGVCRSLDFVQ